MPIIEVLKPDFGMFTSNALCWKDNQSDMTQNEVVHLEANLYFHYFITMLKSLTSLQSVVHDIILFYSKKTIQLDHLCSIFPVNWHWLSHNNYLKEKAEIP